LKLTDFKELLSSYEINLSLEEIELLFKIITDDRMEISAPILKQVFIKYGVSSFESYERILLQIKDKINKDKRNIKEEFQRMDKDNNGNVSENEFRTYISKLNKSISDKDIDDLLKFLNIGFNNQIS